MQVGFNHNFKYKGIIYHIQTEDSGLRSPHIITHLFVGGDIRGTKKTSYADLVGSPNLQEVVRELMEEQHKAMLRDLKAGKFDTEEQQEIAEPPKVQLVGERHGDEEDLFGRDLISDKPLDEVILNFLLQDDGK